jgi:hypothetical protein
LISGIIGWFSTGLAAVVLILGLFRPGLIATFFDSLLDAEIPRRGNRSQSKERSSISG